MKDIHCHLDYNPDTLKRKVSEVTVAHWVRQYLREYREEFRNVVRDGHPHLVESYLEFCADITFWPHTKSQEELDGYISLVRALSHRAITVITREIENE